MVTNPIGVVLCRIAATMIFVQGVTHLANQLPSVLTYAEGAPLRLFVLVLIVLAPVATSAILWCFAERISKTSTQPNQGFPAQLNAGELLGIGIALVGLYALLFGLVYASQVEVGLLAQRFVDKTDQLPGTRLRARVPYVTQIGLGVLLIFGRHKIAKLLRKARSAGTDTS